jgi:crotonobetainyl-CoA:carnitine CoA-transferase CaiB-like acyl-CoA transferase
MVSALDNLRVVDFSRVLAGPFATMMLADLGADVTKIERPGVGDDTRAWGPPWDEAGEATYFQAVNRNKDSVALDFREPADLETARRLAVEADVLFENFRPGVMDRLGLGYDSLKELNPGLVYCSITGFGREAGADLAGYDFLVQAVGGLMSITGEPGGGPQKVGVALIDVLTGLFATVGVMAALDHRRRSNVGQRVEVNLLSSLLAALVNQGSAYTVAGATPTRMGNAHPSIAPYELLHCSDREIAVAVGTDRQFASFCEVLGLGELAGDSRFRTNRDRVAHRETLVEIVESRLGQRDASEWVRDLSAQGIPAGLVNDIPAAFALAEDLGLAPIVTVQHPGRSAVALTRNPIELSATPVRYRSAPPRLPEPAGQRTLS